MKQITLKKSMVLLKLYEEDRLSCVIFDGGGREFFVFSQPRCQGIYRRYVRPLITLIFAQIPSLVVLIMQSVALHLKGYKDTT